MEVFILAAMALVILIFGGLLLAGYGALGRERPGAGTGSVADWPRVALLVPVAGAAPDLTANLASLLSQDYPDYQVVFITRGPEDPATPVIAALIQEEPRASLVLSGPAVTCGQKNHNLLAGLRALGRFPEVLAFCDSTHLAPADWLEELVAPVARGEIEVVSGYHHVLPGDRGLATWGRAITVLILYLFKAVSWINQPWGGATAIKGQLFEDLRVGELWAKNVVDDVSLGVLLLEKGLRVGLAPGANLLTPLTGETLAGWSDWLTRQWLYLKFCLPLAWVAIGLFFYLLLGLTLLSGLRLLAPLLGLAGGPAWPGAVFLGTITCLVTILRSLHPRPPGLLVWLAAVGAAMGMAAWCHLRTWFCREIHWRGISYRVGRKGRVVEIKQTNT